MSCCKRVSRTLTRANSAATKNAFAATSKTTTARRSTTKVTMEEKWYHPCGGFAVQTKSNRASRLAGRITRMKPSFPALKRWAVIFRPCRTLPIGDAFKCPVVGGSSPSIRSLLTISYESCITLLPFLVPKRSKLRKRGGKTRDFRLGHGTSPHTGTYQPTEQNAT